jgi:probable phosphoglycerate mutase
MLLLLARHGNTFDSGDKVVWVGARTDLPLTAKGTEQAAALAKGLVPIRTRLKHISCGPLRRTRDFAQIATGELGMDTEINIDERLREIDYGLWEGKSSEEVVALGGDTELKAWNERGEWPGSPGWSPAPQVIADNVAKAAHELAGIPGDGAALLVTSNGVLKFFLKLVSGAFDQMAAAGKLKVATGNCCALRFSGGKWEVVFWDRRPGELSFER